MRLVILLLALTLAQPAMGLGTDRYDADIRSANKQWLAGSDWLRYRALLYQESRLNPDAVSPVGAEGIAQFMPGTWGDVSRSLGFGVASPRDAKLAINAGAYYLAGRMQFWTEPRPYTEVRRLGEACYNAGCGNILRAQRECRQSFGLCGGACRDWAEIELFLPRITGHHAIETRDYVQKIERWWMMMRL